MSKYVFAVFSAFHLAAALSVVPERAPNLRSPVRRLAGASVAVETKKVAAKASEVVVCRGVGDMKESDYIGMGKVWDRYAAEKIITGTSPLLYRIQPDGKFDSYGKKHELWSQQYLSPPGVKLIPHVFCDSTCCDTCQLPAALANAMARRKEFFAESIEAAQKFGWDGYAMDFEGGMPDRAEASRFFQEWKVELAKHQGRSGQPLEMHMWSPSGLDEASISPNMEAMITMGTYHYGSYSSLLETGANASTNWRQARASMLFQTGAVESICPAGLGAPQKMPKHSLLQGAGEVPRAARLKGLEHGIEGWCSNVQGNNGECGIGLITYDLANAQLRCEDIVKMAKGGHEKGMRSVWLWSGGVIPTKWEQGLKHFSAGANQAAPEGDVCATAFSAAAISSECGCPFDGNYCCDGRSRH